MEAYSRVLSDAVAGDATLFARQDYVEEAWRIVDPVLKAATAGLRLAAYLGPDEVEGVVGPTVKIPGYAHGDDRRAAG